jgi:hypothetical protein
MWIPFMCVLFLLAAVGCDSQPAERAFPVVIQVESDSGVALAGARVLRDNREQGVTAEDGSLRLSLAGHEGDTAALRVACPADYTSPEAAIQVSLRSLADANTVPRYKAMCPPLLRNLVVAVRTQHATGLPVTFRGRELARTDHSGTAHVLLRVPPKEQIALQLDTSADPALRPKSPELTVDMPAQDKIVLFDKAFTREQPPAPKVRRAPKPIGPTPVRVMSR